MGDRKSKDLYRISIDDIYIQIKCKINIKTEYIAISTELGSKILDKEKRKNTKVQKRSYDIKYRNSRGGGISKTNKSCAL